MPTRSSAAAASSSSSAAAAAASISPPRPPSFNGFNSTTSSQGSSSSHARRPTRSTASSVPGQVQPQQQQQPMDSSFWSPGSSASSVFQLAPPHVKDEPDQLAGQFPSLRLASASEAESGTDADRYEEQPLRAYKPSAGGGGASSSSSKAAATTRGAKGGSKRAKVSEDDDDEDDGDEPESGADGGSGVKRKLSLKTRNRLKQRAHRCVLLARSVEGLGDLAQGNPYWLLTVCLSFSLPAHSIAASGGHSISPRSRPKWPRWRRSRPTSPRPRRRLRTPTPSARVSA